MDGNYLSECLIYKVTIFLNALYTKHLLRCLLMNIVMVLAEALSKNVTITIIFLLEIYIMKRTWKESFSQNSSIEINLL